MKWYEQNFVNRRDWVLDHLELLGLSISEAIIVLLIDFCNSNHLEITMDFLQQKTGVSMEEVDKVVSVLCAKKYLEIRASNKNVRFLLDGLYETNIAQDQKILDSPIFDVFETEFGRPLNQKEMQKISDWNRSMDRKLILYALREASAYQKKNLSYIESILTSWKKKGYTAKMIEEGKIG